jgi:hypothetical protein
MGAQRDGELLTQEEVLHREDLPAPERCECSAVEERHPVQHGAMMADCAAHNLDGVLASYNSRSPRFFLVSLDGGGRPSLCGDGRV